MSAADRSYSLGVPEDAAAHLKTALTHAGDEHVRADLQRQQASALRDAGRYEEAVTLAKDSAEAFDGSATRSPPPARSPCGPARWRSAASPRPRSSWPGRASRL